ncbi:MAG: GTPase Era [Chloroflexi bacterium]|nr:GTPase Era [Chloroflexota bacterium]
MTENFRSGFIAIIGRPNVGKSTLVNALLGQKIAAVSPRPQTTRRRQLGILTRKDAQLIFVDTPGIHNPRHKLGEILNKEAEEAMDGVDVIIFLFDVSSAPTEDDARIATLLNKFTRRTPLVLAANKIDLVAAEALTARLEAYQALVRKEAKTIPISAGRGDGLTGLMDYLIASLPVRLPEYEEDQVTDLYEKEIAADLIREAALLKLRDEVPHGIAVRVDEFSERENGVAYISATLFVERDSQKGIVIGKGGRMLKKIGTKAREEIESMGGRKAFLELRVKVEKDWRNNESALKRFGYKTK